MLFSLLVVGGIAFWVILGIVSLIFLACVHNNVLGGAILTAIVTVLGLVLCSDLARVVITNPGDTLLVIAAYPIVGLLWSFIRWLLFLADARDAYLECKNEYPTCTPAQILSKYYSTLHYYGFNTDDGKIVPPTVGAKLDLVSGWVAFWPWSMLDSLLGNVLARFCKWLVKCWSKLFDAVSRYWFKDIV